jgi:alcohol dehydrogenase (NADP+)
VSFQFKPKPFGDYDIDVKITCCGVCGSDLHTATGGWGNKNWPIIPGHGKLMIPE